MRSKAWMDSVAMLSAVNDILDEGGQEFRKAAQSSATTPAPTFIGHKFTYLSSWSPNTPLNSTPPHGATGVILPFSSCQVRQHHGRPHLHGRRERRPQPQLRLCLPASPQQQKGPPPGQPLTINSIRSSNSACRGPGCPRRHPTLGAMITGGARGDKDGVPRLRFLVFSHR